MRRSMSAYKHCRNCKSQRRTSLTKGYCKKCYGYAHLIEKSKQWDLAIPVTLVGYPKESLLRTPEYFSLIKRSVPAQWQQRLDWLRFREQQLTEVITGLELEHAFQRLARYAGARDRYLFHGLANYLTDCFGIKERKEIFKLLDTIEQNIPWKGINWNEVFQSHKGT